MKKQSRLRAVPSTSQVSLSTTKKVKTYRATDRQNNPAYRAWLIRSRGVVCALKLLEKFCMFGDQDSDDEFESDDGEDVEVEQNKEANGQSEVDLNELKNYGYHMLTLYVHPETKNFLVQIVELASSIPMFANIPRPAFEVLLELQEHSFRCLTSILYAYSDNLTFAVE